MGAELSVIVPISITTSQLLSSTIAEPDTGEAVWSSATTYAAGDFAISTVTHRVYECQRDANTNHDPTDIKNQSGAVVWWTDYGPTNRWAMLDGEVSTQTMVASPLTVVISPGAFNSLYIANADADTLSVVIKDESGGNVIHSMEAALEGSAPGDYDGYFFDRFKPQTDFLASDLEQYSSCEITLTLAKGSGTVACGVMAVGDLRALGKTQRKAKAKPRTYSYITTDAFGKTSIKRRKATTDISATAILDISEANTVTAILQEVLDVPAVVIGTDLPEYGGLRVFGLASGEISYDDPEPGLCTLNLNVQGMI